MTTTFFHSIHPSRISYSPPPFRKHLEFTVPARVQVLKPFLFFIHGAYTLGIGAPAAPTFPPPSPFPSNKFTSAAIKVVRSTPTLYPSRPSCDLENIYQRRRDIYIYTYMYMCVCVHEMRKLIFTISLPFPLSLLFFIVYVYHETIMGRGWLRANSLSTRSPIYLRPREMCCDISRAVKISAIHRVLAVAHDDVYS